MTTVLHFAVCTTPNILIHRPTYIHLYTFKYNRGKSTELPRMNEERRSSEKDPSTTSEKSIESIVSQELCHSYTYTHTIYDDSPSQLSISSSNFDLCHCRTPFPVSPRIGAVKDGDTPPGASRTYLTAPPRTPAPERIGCAVRWVGAAPLLSSWGHSSAGTTTLNRLVELHVCAGIWTNILYNMY